MSTHAADTGPDVPDTGPDVPDTPPDVPRDAPRDVPDAIDALDAELADAGEDVSDAPLGDTPMPDRDAWRPEFSPRVFYRNDDVVCAPLARTYGPITRRRGAPGEVLWTYAPELDLGPRLRFIELGLGPGMPIGEVRLYATQAGAAVATLGDRGHQLIVGADGTFVSVVEAFGPYRDPTRMYLQGDDVTLIDSTRYSMYPFLRVLDAESTGGGLPAMPSEIPTEAPRYLGFPVEEIRQPALVPDGSVVWSPAFRTLLRNCADTGRTAWGLEFDHFGWEHWFHVVVDAAGEIVLNDGATYRIAPSGEVLGMRGEPEEMIGYSERCGAVLRSHDGFTPILHYRTGTSFETLTGEIRSSADRRGIFWPTTDCGALEEVVTEGRYGLRRYRSDGTVAFTYHPVHRSEIEPIELDDGSLLIVHRGGIIDVMVPAVEIVDATGAMTARWVLDHRVVGETLARNTAFLTPDGVLYVAGYDDIGYLHRVNAIEIGLTPATPDMRLGAALTWSRSNETWSIE